MLKVGDIVTSKEDKIGRKYKIIAIDDKGEVFKAKSSTAVDLQSVDTVTGDLNKFVLVSDDKIKVVKNV